VIDGAGDLTLRDLSGKAPARKLLRNPNLEFQEAAFSPDGVTLLTAYNDGTLWNTMTGAKIDQHYCLTQALSVACSPDGKSMACVCTGWLYVWDLNPKEGWNIGLTKPPHAPVVFSPDSQYIIAGVTVWDMDVVRKDGKVNKAKPKVVLEYEKEHCVAFSPDSKVLAQAWQEQGEGKVKLWDTTTWQPPKSPAHKFPSKNGFHIAFCPGGQSLLVAGKDGHLIEFDRATWKKQREWYLPFDISGIAVSKDGRHLVTANSNGTIYIWRLAPADK
jgi:WD40 repeat protein